MVRKVFILFSLIAVLAMSFTSMASAETLSGRGWLKAHGSGAAKLTMSGEMTIHVNEYSVIRIRGAEVVKAEGQGHRVDRPDGLVILRGHRGVVKVIGKDMTVHIVGRKFGFLAHGQGTAHLKGHGQYRTKGASGHWDSAGSDLRITGD